MRVLAIIPMALCIGAAPPATSTSKNEAPQGRPGEILLTPPAHCESAEPRRTQGQPLTSRRLDQLPQGNLSLAVMRQVNNCPQSTTVREGYGAPAFRDPSRR